MMISLSTRRRFVSALIIEKQSLFNYSIHVVKSFWEKICFRCTKRTNLNVFNFDEKISNVRCWYCKKIKFKCLEIIIFNLINKILINLENSFVRCSRFKQVSDTSRNYDDLLSKRVRVENCDCWFFCSNSKMNQNHENCQANKNAIRNALLFKREWWHSRYFF